MSDENLWGNLSDLTIKKTPVAILREQAEILSQATKGTLLGDVTSVKSDWAAGIAWELKVRVPAMNNYTATLIKIQHPITIYPLHEFRSPLSKRLEQNVPTEAALKELLALSLKSTEVRSLLAALLSQAQG